MRSPNGVNDSPYDGRYDRARAILMAKRLPCHWCGAPHVVGKMQADHVPPVRVAGKHYNLVTACPPCNLGHVQSPLYPALFREW